MKKDIFYFSRSDRVATIVLLAVIVLSTIIRVGFEDRNTSPAIVQSDSVDWKPKPANQSIQPVPKYTGSDSVSRKTINKYVRSQDSKTYTARQTSLSVSDTARRVSHFKAKQAPLQPLDLNAVDSLTLLSLPGIGAYYASRILGYRQRLGGYTGNKQLSEIEGLPDSLQKWFVVTDSVPLKKIIVNRESLASIRKHPYLNFYQARAIVELRRERGQITGPEQHFLIEELTAQDLERLSPYRDFR